DIAASTFETRRIPLSVAVAIADWITGRTQPDSALGDLDLADAWVKLGVDEAAQLGVGPVRKPCSLPFLSSSSRVRPVARGARMRELDDALIARGVPLSILLGTVVLGEEQQMLDALGYIGREIGAAFHGRSGHWAYEAGVFNGSGEDELDSN